MPKLPRSGQRAKLDIDQQVRLEPSRFGFLTLRVNGSVSTNRALPLLSL
jgi:hypothetical protein